jgi:hypothetical protein
MPDHRIPSAERAVVLQLLRDDRWDTAELQAEISHITPPTLSSALNNLERHGLLVSLDDWVLASRSARHIDELGLIGV